MRLLVSTTILLTATATFAQEERLHERIDRQLAGPVTESEVCSDAEFLRRVSLDLTGQPPSADDVRAFIADESAEKRQLVVDRLLNSPECDRHLTTVFDVMLMERRSNPHVPQDTWHAWLFEQVRQRRPWTKIVRDVLQADGDDSETRPAARFFLDRQSEPHQLTRDVGRIFFGRDLQCAQCHNHPLFDDYLQADYHGLHAFLAPGYPVVKKVKKKEGDKETTKDVTIHAEKAGSDLTFESVFFEGTTRRTGPRLPDTVSITEQFLYPGDEYHVEPAEGVKSVPKMSRRALLAEHATSGDNRFFNENIANRLWAHMLGRGLVHPVDLHHFDNPPADPELLRILGEQIAAMNFDARQFLGEIALSRVYQQPFDQPDNIFDIAAMATQTLHELEQEKSAMEQAVTFADEAWEAATDSWDAAQESYVPVAAELDKVRKTYDEARKILKTANAELQKKQSELKTHQDALPKLQQAAESTALSAGQLPDSFELKTAAELFSKRASEVEQAIGPLQTSVTELTAAAEKAHTEFAAQKQQVDTARAKLPPLLETLRTTESALLENRRKMQQSRTVLAATARQLESLQQLTELPAVQGKTTAAQAVVAERQQQLSELQQLVASQTTTVDERQVVMTKMAQPIAEAEQAVETAQATHAMRRKPIDAIQQAIQAAELAQAALPNDAILTSVTNQLNERLVPLQTEMAEAQSAVDQAMAEHAQQQEMMDEAARALQEAVAEQDRLKASREELMIDMAKATTEVEQAETALNVAMTSLADRRAQDFKTASLKPLTPEQLCWSMMKVTGVYDRQQKAEATKLETDNPLTDEQKQDPEQLIARQREIEQRTYAALKVNVGSFVQVYAAAAGQPQNDFFATADQALFVANASVLNGWIAPTSGNVTERIINAEDPHSAAEELYLAVLNRLPSDDEAADVKSLLKTPDSSRSLVATELVWALLTSIEFRFNH
jgi:hypothetical protein